MRICRPGVVAAVGGLALGAATACDVLGPARYAPRDEYAVDDEDDAPRLDTRNDSDADPPPPAPVATVSETEWNERFERAQRAKHDRASELNGAVDRCYQKLRDPGTGGSATLAQAICFGGNPPKTAASRGVGTPSVVDAASEALRPFDPTAARARLRSLHLEACARGAPGAFAEADVTFAATGRVASVAVSLPAEAPSDERACVVRKANEARTSPFEGAAVHVSFTWFRGGAAR